SDAGIQYDSGGGNTRRTRLLSCGCEAFRHPANGVIHSNLLVQTISIPTAVHQNDTGPCRPNHLRHTVVESKSADVVYDLSAGFNRATRDVCAVCIYRNRDLNGAREMLDDR